MAVLALGHGGALYPFGVTDDGQPDASATAIVAISAPVLSLVLGAAVLIGLPRTRRAGFWHVFLLWLGAASFMEGAGYLFITPFGAGDTAVTMEALDLPVWVALVAAVAGAALIFLGARLVAPHVVRLVGRDDARNWALVFHPWRIATILNLGIYLAYLGASPSGLSAGEQIAVLAGSAVLLVLGPMSAIFQGKTADEHRSLLVLAPVPVAGLVAFGMLVAVNVALLRGWHIG